MAIKKIRMRPEGTNDYADVLHPETSAEQVIMNSGETLEDTIDTHLAETMQLKFSELSSTATNMDSEGIYKNIEWKRKDSTLYAKSILLGTTPNYNQIKIDYYNNLGTTIDKTITWNLAYDDNGFIYKKDVI